MASLVGSITRRVLISIVIKLTRGTSDAQVCPARYSTYIFTKNVPHQTQIRATSNLWAFPPFYRILNVILFVINLSSSLATNFTIKFALMQWKLFLHFRVGYLDYFLPFEFIISLKLLQLILRLNPDRRIYFRDCLLSFLHFNISSKLN